VIERLAASCAATRTSPNAAPNAHVQRLRDYPHVEPSAKSPLKLRVKVRAVLNIRTRNEPTVAVNRKVNRLTRGWANAFRYANSTRVFGKQQSFNRLCLRCRLRRR
jgi:hypothetical protein